MRDVAALAAAVDPGALARHLAAMPGPRRRPHDASAIAMTLAHLRRTFAAHGWEVREEPCRDSVLGDGMNLVARLAGARPDALVVVAAHHDTVPGSPGADDDGSGLAALCELARLLRGPELDATVELVAFDFEESNDPFGDRTPSFAGSRAYVETLGRDDRTLRGAFVYDLIGYATLAPGSQRLPPGLDRAYPAELAALQARGRGDFLAAIGLGDERGIGLLRAFVGAAHAAAPDLAVVPLAAPVGVAALADLFRSDHVSFWRADLPAVFLTDTANFRNPNYHQPTDVASTLDAVFWSRVVAATLGAVVALARSD